MRLILLAVVAGLTAASHAQTIFVDRDATGTGDGSSWTNAFTDLSDALAAAPAGGELWVAEGSYRPDEDDALRELSFQLRSGVAVYGGFSGTETQRDERDPALHPTILTGDLLGNDGPNFANYADNSFHVVVASGTDNTAILDGFTISGGCASDFGGGIYSLGGSPTIRGCTITRNCTAEVPTQR